MTRTFMITGGCGFIGSAMIRQLLRNPECRVVNVDKLTYAGNQESIAVEAGSDRYNFENVDICDNTEIQRIFSVYQPDFVMHFAAESHVDRSIECPGEFIQTNIVGTFNLLEQARLYFGGLSEARRQQFRFHHISTDEVYGDLDSTAELFTENTAYAPSSPYSASKASADHLVRAWGRTYGLPILITNCSNNYGPYHFPEKLIPCVIISALLGKPLPIYGDGLQIRDWLYVEDHTNALFKVITEGKLGDTYNIGGHNEKSNLDVVKSICNLLEELAPVKPAGVKKYEDLLVFVTDRPGHDCRYAVDATKIEYELGWVPEESFESGLRKTVQWYLDNRYWWERVLSGEYRLERIGGEL